MAVKTTLDGPLHQFVALGAVITGTDAIMTGMLKHRAACIIHTVESLAITHEDGTAPVPWGGDPFGGGIEIDLSPPKEPPTWTELDFPDPDDADVPEGPDMGGIPFGDHCAGSEHWLRFYWRQFLLHGHLPDLERAIAYLKGMKARGCPFTMSFATNAWTTHKGRSSHFVPGSWGEWLMMARMILFQRTPDLPLQHRRLP